MPDGDASRSDAESPVFGIDLGTSNSCVALWVKGTVEIVRNLQGDRTTPSVVAVGAEGKITVGAPARRQAVMNPKTTFSEVKRLVGLRFSSPQVTAAREILPYEICSATNGDAWTAVGNDKFSPVELQAYILEELAVSCSQFIGREAKRVVITVPAFFDETQRQAVRDAGHIAGLAVERILSEPTAAALAYGYAQLDDRHIAVVDLGGGTLDVTIMKVDQGKFEVLGTDGDNALGGADFDRALASHFAEDVRKTHAVDLGSDPVAMQRLLGEAERAKKELTNSPTVHVSLPYLTQKDGQPVNFEYDVTQDLYRALVSDLVERIAAPCREAVSLAGLRASELDDVILIGGMTRSPVVQEKIAAIFERKPLARINPDEAVAMGAALLGAGLSGKLDEVTFVDVAPRSIGLRAAGDRFVPLIKKSSTLPARCRKGFKTTKDDQRSFELDIFQGESAKASENRNLAHVTVAPITRKPAGQVMLEVLFEVDAQGTLVVHAKERGTSEPISATIEPTSGLTGGQVEQLAAVHAKSRTKISYSEKEDASDAGGGFSINIAKSKNAPTTKTAKPKSSRELTSEDLFADLPIAEPADQSRAENPKAQASQEEQSDVSPGKRPLESGPAAVEAEAPRSSMKLFVGIAVVIAIGAAAAVFALSQ